MLREITPSARERLRQRMAGMDDAARAEFARRLLAADPAQRAALLETGPTSP